MKTCTQISDSEFRGKINVVNPGDSAEVPVTLHTITIPKKSFAY